MDEQTRALANNFAATTIQDYPVVNLKQYLNLGDQMRLEAGQHRRAAIMRMNGLSDTAREGIFTREPDAICKQSTMWAIEVYELESLNRLPIVRNWIIRNEINITRPASGGDLFSRFHQAWSGLTPEQRQEVKSSHLNFNKFLTVIFGPDPSHHYKIYPIIKHSPWNNRCVRLCSIP
ncbi:hypothetical protein DTO195F2_5131 [Paecilomyces variotii]|nr:hypothetical protein DTO195F2_5131 [Paecilomyces variotii]